MLQMLFRWKSRMSKDFDRGDPAPYDKSAIPTVIIKPCQVTRGLLIVSYSFGIVQIHLQEPILGFIMTSYLVRNRVGRCNVLYSVCLIGMKVTGIGCHNIVHVSRTWIHLSYKL
jgi:hypothetical protein